jgi:hypothetical protein
MLPRPTGTGIGNSHRNISLVLEIVSKKNKINNSGVASSKSATRYPTSKTIVFP